MHEVSSLVFSTSLVNNEEIIRMRHDECMFEANTTGKESDVVYHHLIAAVFYSARAVVRTVSARVWHSVGI